MLFGLPNINVVWYNTKYYTSSFKVHQLVIEFQSNDFKIITKTKRKPLGNGGYTFSFHN